MANAKLGIKLEPVKMLKIQNVWNLFDAFAVILPQQRTVSVSAHAQSFFSWSLARIFFSREMQTAKPPKQL